MPTTDVPNNLVEILESMPQAADELRLNSLKQMIALASAERTALDLERKRLEAKYGSDAPQAKAAADRVQALEREREALKAEAERASVKPPRSSAEYTIVFGRVVDSAGKPVLGAKVAAVDASANVLASDSVDDTGAYELRVPVTKPGKIRTEHAQAGQPAGPFRLQIIGPKKNTIFKGEEDLDAAEHRVTYRDLVVQKS